MMRHRAHDLRSSVAVQISVALGYHTGEDCGLLNGPDEAGTRSQAA